MNPDSVTPTVLSNSPLFPREESSLKSVFGNSTSFGSRMFNRTPFGLLANFFKILFVLKEINTVLKKIFPFS